jgi:hypothetical protein
MRFISLGVEVKLVYFEGVSVVSQKQNNIQNRDEEGKETILIQGAGFESALADAKTASDPKVINLPAGSNQQGGGQQAQA